MNDIETRLDRLESIEAIKRLKARYAECADGKYTDGHRKRPVAERDAVARQQAACFTEDGEFSAGAFGHVRGREALFENFRDKPFRFAMHMYMNPLIEVDGDTGTGRWVHWLLATESATDKAVHMCSYTLDTYRRVDGEWLFAKVEVVAKFMVGFDEPFSSGKPA
jgi:hypothetical protein